MADSEIPTTLPAPRLMPDCEAWVEVDGEPAPVYSTTIRGSKSTGYIESIEGARFEIYYREGRRKAPSKDYTAELYLDGRWVHSAIFYKTSPLFSSAWDSEERLAIYSSARISPTSERFFNFTKFSETEDEATSCKEKRVIQQMGSIQVRIFRGEAVEAPSQELLAKHELEDVVVHENLKLNLTHQISLGPAQDTEEMEYADFKYIDSLNDTFVTFEFRYRFLELEGLAPPRRDASTPLVVVTPEPEHTPPAAHAEPNAASSLAAQQATGGDVVPGHISSSDDEAALIKAERKTRTVGVKEEDKPRLKKVKSEEEGSSGKAVAKGKKGKTEVIVLD
ncbi:hypothetical protein BCR35DRAFT_335818 [Leucosporidium creatinivorum]|uniref:DUF7918 domain-containing protein n=1 Tax=Leucosporidium creatinivorum TaxID=106004 RepID=A0A1Y2D594_9BASI|nr:hypothetical protein BCR35DRAFT_335818 [Leucosporidium creatinivorum]